MPTMLLVSMSLLCLVWHHPVAVDGRGRTRLCKRVGENLDETFYNVFGVNRLKELNFKNQLGLYDETTTAARTTYVSGVSKCERQKTAMCPHYAVLNYDADRVPDILYEARCSCINCGDGNVCRPVYYYRYVLHKDRRRSCFNQQLMRISVGCQCMEKNVGENTADDIIP